ncbi:MAG: hypothetical protein F6K37_16620 [Moorea sp. SIO4E2]|uniref:hypothetical protein n=1 Tax=Moorena sp. SIO4E2 TaxID=2607826 RepID=UPI0013B686BD|nr:hypothetical protein [Moorena sp. SIO4E2]NEQ07510.1 hypothetical protein [Moorena sp. SIO4E2]
MCDRERKYSAISYQLSAISYQLSAISYQLSAISYQLMRTLLEVLQMVLLNKRCRGATRGEFNYGSNAPLRSWGGSAAKGGSPHDRAAVVSPTRAWDQDNR